MSGNGSTLTLTTDIINACADACCLEAAITTDLRLTKYECIVGGKYFVRLRRLRRVRRSLDANSAVTFIYAFITSRIDYCNCLFAGATKVWTDKLRRFLNAEALVRIETNKYDPGLVGIVQT